MSDLRSAPVLDDPIAIAEPVDHELRRWLDTEAARWSRTDPSMGELVRDLAGFVLGGGKRLRPAFVLWGYAACDHDPHEPAAVRVAAAMELLHAFALLHDDVMDGSLRRRGKPSHHVRVRAQHRAAGWRGESRRFGEGLAILLGDLAFVYADQLIADAPSEVHQVWHEMRVELTMGQLLDVVGAARGDRDLERSELIALYKSGRYSVERPLQLGAALGGRLDELGPDFGRFGAPLGEAFQLRDDLLGAFGDEATIGKPVGDDLREGKPTVLLAYAHALASPAQRVTLDQIGRADLSDATVADIQDVLVRCGAVDAVEGAIAVRVEAARAALAATPVDARTRRALGALADRLAWRDR
jgi:geranylgeranyl diphosphate synthase type I